MGSTNYNFHSMKTLLEVIRFMVPRSAVGTYSLAFVRPSVRSFARASIRSAEILKSVHRNFLIFWHKVGAS